MSKPATPLSSAPAQYYKIFVHFMGPQINLVANYLDPEGSRLLRLDFEGIASLTTNVYQENIIAELNNVQLVSFYSWRDAKTKSSIITPTNIKFFSSCNMLTSHKNASLTVENVYIGLGYRDFTTIDKVISAFVPSTTMPKSLDKKFSTGIDYNPHNCKREAWYLPRHSREAKAMSELRTTYSSPTEGQSCTNITSGLKSSIVDIRAISVDIELFDDCDGHAKPLLIFR